MKRTLLAALLALGAWALGACTPPAVQTAAPTACMAPLKPAVEVDLYFGEVSPTEWRAFLDEEVTPRFPDGLSVIDIYGQYRNRQGTIGRERSKLLVIVVFDAPAHAPRVQAIVDSYRRRYKQESVLRVERSICAAL
jgi:broad specificity phosphatase PhoE